MIGPRIAAVLTFAAIAVTSAQQQPTFRARTDVVSVSVSVKKGNNPVTGLTARDFVLRDRGIAQQVDAVTIEAVPIDVTLFMDTSGSTAGARDQMKKSVRAIVGMLRPGDRFRLLTIGHSVNLSIPWIEAGAPFDLDVKSVGGISLVYDAVAAALRHPIDPGRRHLIVAMTDGMDCGSIVDPAVMVEMASRSDAVLHWLDMVGFGLAETRAFCDQASINPQLLSGVAERTGGTTHGTFLNPNPVKEFERIFSDFRQSYVLLFTPTGVAPAGWHELEVKVPGASYTIHARSGYFGG